MHVVRHHHPGEKTIKMPLAVSDQNGTGHDAGNPRVAKPSGSRGALIQKTILSHESVAASREMVGSPGPVAIPLSAR